MESNNSQALTSFLVMDFLEKQGVSSSLFNNLSQELSKKSVFKSMININGIALSNTFGDLKSQLPSSKKSLLNDLVAENYSKQKERLLLHQEKDKIVDEIQNKHQIFDKQRRRAALTRRHNTKSIRKTAKSFEDYPSEIFTEYWSKFKTFFGHLKTHPEPDDPLSRSLNSCCLTLIDGCPVYNLQYDKTGKYVITAADDGVIKIWSTVNGELLNIFMGHTSDINTINISHCGNYLGSCSNDGFVRVWHIETGYPIAVFKESNGIIVALNFFNVPVRAKPNQRRRGIVTASEDGNVFVYFEEDYLENGGLKRIGQKKMRLRAGENVTAFSSIDVHPEGFIVAGTIEGYVVVWNRIPEIDVKRMEKHRICKKEHTKESHLTVWSKQGTHLLSASFDGTAKIYPWNSNSFESNRDLENMYVFEAETGKRGNKFKCCAVSWSCKSKYAFASFCQITTSNYDDNETIVANIQVYNMKLKQRVQKFDRSYDNKPFENYMFILEPHPFNEAIVVSADYDGKIIIWDVERGQMLNSFIEDCGHFGFPLSQAPILDGKFSPDGLSFAVSNYYGSLSFYGYGEKDLFLTTPTEQFYEKEFTDFEINPDTYQIVSYTIDNELHFADKGALCSSKERPYYEGYRPEYFSETKHYEKYVKALQRKKYEKKAVQEGINSEDCINALKKDVKNKTDKEIEEAMQEFYNRYLEKKGVKEQRFRPLNTIRPTVPKEKGQLKRLARSIQRSSADEEDGDQWEEWRDDEQSFMRGRIDEIKMVIEDYKEKSDQRRSSEGSGRSEIDIEEDEEDTQAQQARKRKARRMILDSEDTDNQASINEILAAVNQRAEQAEQNTRNTSPQKKLRKLVLDEEEDSKREDNRAIKNEVNEMDEEREPKSTTKIAIRRSSSRQFADENGIQLVRSESRDVMGRRNRQLANNSSNVRETINAQINLRANMDRVLEIPPVEAVEDVHCSRCGLENARLKCSNGCGRAYHTGCSKRHCRETGRDVVTCFPCLSQTRKKEKPNGTKVDRAWTDGDVADQMNFLPQVGDMVTYVFQDHEEYIMKHFDFLRFSQNEVFPFEKEKNLLQDNVCKIIDIKYQLPLSPRGYKGPLNVLMKITLQILEPENPTNTFFKVTYFQSTLCSFMIQRDVYIKYINRALSLHIGQQISVKASNKVNINTLTEVTPREAGPFPDSHWKVLQTVESGKQPVNIKAIKEQTESIIYVSPWELALKDQSFLLKTDSNMTKDFLHNAILNISALYENSVDKFEIFLEEVDKKDYPNYLKTVAFEMNINKIKNRINNLFYRHKETIISDILLIRFNCHRYNEPTSCISLWSNELADNMIKIIDPAGQHRITLPEKVINPAPIEDTKKNDLQKTQLPELANMSTREQTLESQQPEESFIPRSRTRRLQVQDDEEEEAPQQEKNVEDRARLKKINQEQSQNPFETISAHMTPSTNHSANASEHKNRLRKGNEPERRSAGTDNSISDFSLKAKQRRKEDEIEEKMNRNLAINQARGLVEPHQPSQIARGQAVGGQVPKSEQRTGGYKSRLRRNDRKNFAQFFEDDSDEDEDSDEEEEEKIEEEKVETPLQIPQQQQQQQLPQSLPQSLPLQQPLQTPLKPSIQTPQQTPIQLPLHPPTQQLTPSIQTSVPAIRTVAPAITTSNNRVQPALVQTQVQPPIRQGQVQPVVGMPRTTHGHPLNTAFQHHYIGIENRPQQPILNKEFTHYMPRFPPPTIVNEMPRFPDSRPNYVMSQVFTSNTNPTSNGHAVHKPQYQQQQQPLHQQRYQQQQSQPQLQPHLQSQHQQQSRPQPQSQLQTQLQQQQQLRPQPQLQPQPQPQSKPQPQSQPKNNKNTTKNNSESEEDLWSDSFLDESEPESDFEDEDYGVAKGKRRQNSDSDDAFDELAELNYKPERVRATRKDDFVDDSIPKRQANRNKKLKI